MNMNILPSVIAQVAINFPIFGNYLHFFLLLHKHYNLMQINLFGVKNVRIVLIFFCSLLCWGSLREKKIGKNDSLVLSREHDNFPVVWLEESVA